ncbi:MAG TPA: PadR family transcriptional regulator [Candidatus Sulfotelmatobacter sp.]|nr:PadR family transcriptional regulator [Candidatus Sulfotelmatobacter sp.]
MELGPTAYVILGVLGLGPHSGYDIKQLADLSTRHFWATSYGQIYPELKRLADSGLIKAEDASRGTRQRTLYHLTAKGKQTLHAWASDPVIQNLEIRDEMLLKLFFADAMSRKDTVRHLQAMSRRHDEVADALREHEPMAAEQPHRMKYEVMKFGIALHEWCADWYGRLAKDLEMGKETKR